MVTIELETTLDERKRERERARERLSCLKEIDRKEEIAPNLYRLILDDQR
jgi:hypothetical protein